ncbi:4Fe-4S dicluster domain-containing protein [Sporichthya polymorpha]|uniref:4Fe-4S dicluster domain-containing protein n=1 Tax=Sporichthya polymorpha TaxID=35751 RepID=UPI0003742D5F|nr:4Fe-4S dicluster domain-containing protein [Sporichthya polymorpha]
MRYGFAIDQRTCIGCHACTVACKTEHEIPVGQFRTWVKYVDSGTFPDNTRDFGVMRCNHCTDAPCVKICPTHALFTRKDGIVDFDGDSCIGCKSCLQACPYDALYIDENTSTAAKCNFCAHRVDEGLEPACVVVCPTHSIWVGDLEDENSGISQLIASNETRVRAPEQKTGPNVFYIGATIPVLDPLQAPTDEAYIYSLPDKQRAMVSSHLPPSADNAKTTLNTAHPRPWGWRVTTYLWTKGVAAGVLLVIALAMVLGKDLGRYQTVWAPLIALGGVTATGVLLVWDLKRPERFWYIFTKGNWTSWLFKGSLALAAFAGVAGIWLLLGISAESTDSYDLSAWQFDLVDAVTYLAIPAAVLLAGYTAFLFAQAEGRDLWQSKLLFPHLIVQAVMVGAGTLAVVYGKYGADPSTPFRSKDDGSGNLASPLLAEEPDPVSDFLIIGPEQRVGNAGFENVILGCLVVATVVHIAFAIVEFYSKHETKQATAAARLATRGPYRFLFHGSLVLALVAAACGAFAWSGDNMEAAIWAGIGVQVALLMYESVFVRAGQDVPLS